jgi:hypothetical protein
MDMVFIHRYEYKNELKMNMIYTSIESTTNIFEQNV